MSVFLDKARALALDVYRDGDWHSGYLTDSLRFLRGVGRTRAYELMDRLVAEGTLERRAAQNNEGRGGFEYRLAAGPEGGPDAS